MRPRPSTRRRGQNTTGNIVPRHIVVVVVVIRDAHSSRRGSTRVSARACRFQRAAQPAVSARVPLPRAAPSVSARARTRSTIREEREEARKRARSTTERVLSSRDDRRRIRRRTSHAIPFFPPGLPSSRRRITLPKRIPAPSRLAVDAEVDARYRRYVDVVSSRRSKRSRGESVVAKE